MTRSLPPSYFEALYASDPDPWRFASSDYERDKYAATLAALPKQLYRSGLEVGCSIGVLTAMLASRCRRLLALDVADEALAQARERCRALPQVTLARLQIPDETPSGSFDLIVLSEVVYYFDREDVRHLARYLNRALEPGGDLLLVHWTGATDYPISGDEATDLLIAGLDFTAQPLAASRHERYRLDLFRRLDAEPALVPCHQGPGDGDLA